MRLDPDERRAQIRAAAWQAFAAAPYEQVSLAAIAAAAGSSEALIHKYFSTKADLYAEVLRARIHQLADRQRAASASLPPGAPVRDHLRSSLEVYLDFISEQPIGWAGSVLAGGNDPLPARTVRAAARESYVDALRDLLGNTRPGRDEFAVLGYFGFLDAACLHWVKDGCRHDQRWNLMDAALGCLEGALGDWHL